MDPILIFLLALVGACPVLLLAGALVRAARRRARRAPPTEVAPAQPEPVEAGFHPFPYHPAELPPEQSAGYWWARLLSREAALGAILALLQLPIITINSYVLALRLEMLLGNAGAPLFLLSLLGWEREITLFDVVGCLISLIQIVSAAAFANQQGRFAWPKLAALGAWLLMMTVEVALSVYSGLANDGLVHLAFLNGVLAGGLALADSLIGLYCIEYFAIPLALAVGWTLALPFRALSTFVRARAARYAIRPKAPTKPKPQSQPKMRVVSSIVGALDPVFRPLRDLDAAVYRLLRRRITKNHPDKEAKGELVCANSK